MTAVDYQLHAAARRIPYHTLVDTTCLPGPCSGLCGLEADEITYHRAVQPVGQQAPAFVRRHSKYRLLRGQLDCERLLRQLLRRIAPQSDTAVRSYHIHSSVRIINGHLVVYHPLGVLAADPEINELVYNRSAYDCSKNIRTADLLLAEITAAALLNHNDRQSGIAYCDVISP